MKSEIIKKDNQESLLLINEISHLIEKAKSHVAREYNVTHLILNWMIGKRINDEILKSRRAEYGEQIIIEISKTLTLRYGGGYSRPNLFRMVRFAKLFPKKEIISTMSRQLSWSHFVLIGAIEDGIKRDFYIQMCKVQKWSVRDLQKQIKGMLYERTAISKKPDKIIQESIKKLEDTDEMSTNLIFKDPYFIDFIGSKEYSNEEELEGLILDNITKFLQELGNEFCFVARQKRMSIKNKDRYLDLLFYNRRLRCLVALDLKIGDFEPAHKGQMEWYLSWLDKHEKLEYENKPIGIVLCAGKDHEDIEYMKMEESGIHVAEYITELPTKGELERKLHMAIKVGKEVYERKALQLKDELDKK